ncbi:hypothetical protein ANOM_010421 [Aspergillus nomiae NRRL 13137]|uniref:Uncharacterized protein n=1 Tax=Aspergillus nomiae NRRL (strain ATCC 15546 / NRRL 13137 / CBS 260.88 / M93) TaxID=1509407 RepID=A0A0L1INP2_ASPN3|nr:uncharacterized protein ANOM_010421 [Aspergillus nomiae NRRL 13137]KNG80843.1 hypothetical protein ANOM_010421 [Aspergillus nomiae NRRL 13137]
MSIKQARARKVASQALPQFSLGPNHIKSNALHDIEFVIKYTHGLGDPEAESQLIGDKTGLQGVFNHSVGFMTQLKVVGELKTPWVYEYEARKAYEEEAMPRHLHAQPIKYMRDLNCMYGFMSDYCRTIFLGQEFLTGRWVVDYSLVI